MLHLVGETIDARRAHHCARAGALVPLIRGIYVESDSDIETVILGHAVRIARYLYPSAYLSSASSLLLGPAPDGRLFISGRRNQRTRLRTLEIIQNKTPENPSTAPAVIGDDLGELHVDISSPRQRFLEAFRMRSEHASAVTPEMRHRMAWRLVEEHGSPDAAAESLWALARGNGWYREGERAERFLLQQPAAARVPLNKAALSLLVAWHGELIGHLTHDGFEWRWESRKRAAPTLVRENAPGKLPPFIESLLPEGWLAQVLREGDRRQALRNGRRYMSNVSVAPSRAELVALQEDILSTPLEAFCEAGRFTGRYRGPGRGPAEETFERNLAGLYSQPGTPRLSGVQIKAPMSLLADGTLLPAHDRAFTHVLKPAGTAGFEMLPVVEWLCLEFGRACSFEVPSTALIEMPDGIPPALLVERFDIRRGPEDRRRLALEDFCSILDLPASAKYDSTIERMARALRPVSTDPDSDLGVLFRRAVLAWLIADGDMHLKNVALLRAADAGARAFASVRLAPLYDAVTTRVFPGLGGDRMAFKLNGKDDRLRLRDFLATARTIGLPDGEAEAAVTDLATRLSGCATTVELPVFARQSEAAMSMRDRVSRIATERAAALMQDPS